LISFTRTAEAISLSAKHLTPADSGLKSGHDPVYRSNDSPCFGSSAVYYCTGNSCSAFERYARSVSPWSPG
jgi:hypothetical protein